MKRGAGGTNGKSNEWKDHNFDFGGIYLVNHARRSVSMKFIISSGTAFSFLYLTQNSYNLFFKKLSKKMKKKGEV